MTASKPFGTREMVAADVNHDGHADIVMFDDTSTRSRRVTAPGRNLVVSLGQHDGTFSAPLHSDAQALDPDEGAEQQRVQRLGLLWSTAVELDNADCGLRMAD